MGHINSKGVVDFLDPLPGQFSTLQSAIDEIPKMSKPVFSVMEENNHLTLHTLKNKRPF